MKKYPAFVHIEKTGGTSLVEYLRSNVGVAHCDIIPSKGDPDFISLKDLEHAEKMYPWLGSLAGHSFQPYNSYGSFDKKLMFVTLLRNPISRYISEYNHDRCQRGYPNTIQDWMKYEHKHNYQTKCIAGTDSVDAAIKILNNKFHVVGLLEEYEEFLVALSNLFTDRKMSKMLAKSNTVDSTKRRIANIRPPISCSELPQKLIESIKKVNSSDIALYEYVVANKPDVVGTNNNKMKSQVLKRNRLANVLYRNFIYKPSVGRFPIKIHSLPKNEMNELEKESYTDKD